MKTTSIKASESMRGAGGKTQLCRPFALALATLHRQSGQSLMRRPCHQSIEQRLFDRRRACERNLRKKLRIQTGGDENHPGKHGDSKTAAQPFPDAKSSLEKRQHSSASQKRQGKGCRRAEGVGQEQK